MTEMDIDLSILNGLCGETKSEGDQGSGAGGCEGMLSGLGGGLTPLTEEISRSLRLVELTVSWPVRNGMSSMEVRTILRRDDDITPGQVGEGALPPGVGGSIQQLPGGNMTGVPVQGQGISP